jgi:hypothetical protein
MNRKSLMAAAAMCALLAILAPVLLAHHSNAAQYDATKRITITGAITKIEWTNPHAYLYLNVKDASGKVQQWSLEGFPPNTLLRTGWKTEMIKVGDILIVEGATARDGSPLLLAREITLPDGKKLFWGPQS